MRACLALALVAAMATPGHGQEPPAPSPAAASDPVTRIFRLTLPDEWRRHDEQSTRIRKRVQDAEHFAGAVPYQAGADAFAGPEGMMFYVTWVAARGTVGDPAAALRTETDRLKRRWCGDGDRARKAWSETARDGVIDAVLAWHDRTDGVVSASRTLLYAADGKPRMVMAECVMRADDIASLGPRCDRLRATLALSGVEEPTALAVAPSAIGDGCEDEAPEPDRVDVVPRTPTTIGQAPEGAGNRGVLYTGEGKQSSGSGNKLIMLGGAVLLVVAIYLTTRNRREDADEDDGKRAEHEHEGGEGDGDAGGDREGAGDDDDE